MRHNHVRTSPSALTWIIGSIVVGFVLENIALRCFSSSLIGNSFLHIFALSPDSIRNSFVWTLLSYSLLHDPGQFLHILGNLLAIFFLGRELIPLIGSRRFTGICVGAVMLGGLVWLGCNWNHGGNLIGASAAVCGLLIVFACINPDRSITLLLFFFLPVTVKPKYLALGLLAFDFFGLLFLEIPKKVFSLNIAHSAHIGGMLAGWIYFRHIHPNSWSASKESAGIELPQWFRRARKHSAPAPVYQVNIGNRETLRVEIDRILDKINSQGFASLTPEEKRLLDTAKHQFSRH